MDAGIDCLRRASDGEPGNVAYRVMLVRALTDNDRAEEALEIATPPGGTSPAELALWHARAEAAQKSSNHAAAAEAWQVLCTARPDDWRSWANYGDALAGLDRWPDAASALRRAVALNPGEPPLQENFASALARAGFHDEAADYLKAMLDAEPDDAGVRLTLARLLADLGRQDEFDGAARPGRRRLSSADRRRDRAIWGSIRIALGDRKDASEPLSPRELRSLRELALLLERTNRMEALRNLLDEVERLGFSRDALGYPAAAVALRDDDAVEAKRLLMLEPKSDPARWHRLMAKILNSPGDPEGAFAAAEAMNQSVSDFDGWVRRGASTADGSARWPERFSPEWAARLRPLEPGLGPHRRFLVGFPRSGTTLLDTFLMGHPLTAVSRNVRRSMPQNRDRQFLPAPVPLQESARTGSERLFRRARPVRRSELLRVGYRQASAQHAGPAGDLQPVPRRPDNLCPAASVRRGVERLHAELRAQRCDGLLPDDRGQRRFLRRGNDLVYARPRRRCLSHRIPWSTRSWSPIRAVRSSR